MNALGDRIRAVIVLVQADEEHGMRRAGVSPLRTSAAALHAVECEPQMTRGYHVACMLPVHTCAEEKLCSVTELVLGRVRDFYNKARVPVTYVAPDELTSLLTHVTQWQSQASSSNTASGAAVGAVHENSTLWRRCMERAVSVLQCKASQLAALRAHMLPALREQSCDATAVPSSLPACLFVELDLAHSEDETRMSSSPCSPTAATVVCDVNTTPGTLHDKTAQDTLRDVLDINALRWLRPVRSSYVSETRQEDAPVSTGGVRCTACGGGHSGSMRDVRHWLAVPTHMYSNYPIIRDTGLCRAPRDLPPAVAMQYSQCTLSAMLRECAFKAGAMAKYGS